jgi:hypothetical protein
MRKSRGWTGLRITALALGCALSSTGANAVLASAISTDGTNTTVMSNAPVLSYDTVGSSISNTGVVGTQVVSFVPTSGGSFLAPSSLSLGSFQAASQPAGSSTKYTNTPFSIKFNADALNGSQFQPNETPVTISGVLNGTLSGNNQSSVVATFNSIDKPNFQTGLYSNSLAPPGSALNIVPSTTNNGLSTVQVMLASTATGSPVPEPSTILIFGASIVGIGLWGRRRLPK